MKDQVQITVTGEGLRIESRETEKGMFFESGNSKPSPAGQDVLIVMAKGLGKLPNNILLEGHTDSKPFAEAGTYTNWELSNDRANSARRLMQARGLRPEQIKQVRGFADQQLRVKAEPLAASNRRISMIVQYRNPAPQEKAEKK